MGGGRVGGSPWLCSQVELRVKLGSLPRDLGPVLSSPHLLLHLENLAKGCHTRYLYKSDSNAWLRD